jgi:hypothetical protein
MIHIRASFIAILVAGLGASAASAAEVAPLATNPTGNGAISLDTPRKGTRNYRDGDPLATAPATTVPLKNDGLSQKDKLAQCMDTWDTGTHITKSKWREICIRQLNER